MTDHTRGAYAPQHDAPLTFDTFDARGRPGRRPMPMTLIGSAVVLLVLVTALVMFYRSGVKGAGGPPRPVGEASAAIKTAPGAATQPSDEGAGLAVYSPQNVPNAAAPTPSFAPTPEQPMARPAPKSPLASVVASTPPARTLQVETAPLHAVPTEKPAPVLAKAAPPAAKPAPKSEVVAKSEQAPAEKPVAVAKSDTVKPDAIGSAKLVTKAVPARAEPAAPDKTVAKADSSGLITTTLGAKPRAAKVETAKLEKPAPVEKSAEKPAAEVKAETVAATAPAGGHAVMVQIGAFSSTSQVDKGWASAAAAASGRMGGKGRKVEKVERDGKTLYRTSVTGFSARSDAAAFCATLSAKGLACMVKG